MRERVIRVIVKSWKDGMEANSTSSRRGLVFVVVTLFMVVSSLQQVPRGTGKSVSVWVIGKGLFREDAFLPS